MKQFIVLFLLFNNFLTFGQLHEYCKAKNIDEASIIYFEINEKESITYFINKTPIYINKHCETVCAIIEINGGNNYYPIRSSSRRIINGRRARIGIFDTVYVTLEQRNNISKMLDTHDLILVAQRYNNSFVKNLFLVTEFTPKCQASYKPTRTVLCK